MDNSEEFQEVIKGYRAKLLTAYAISFVLIAAIVHWGKPFILNTANTMGFENGILLKESIRSLLLFLIIVPSTYIIHVGKEIVKEQRYPSTKMKMLQRTPIVRGEKAVVQGRKLMRLGKVAIVLILFSIVATRVINDKFIENPLSYNSSQDWDDASHGEYKEKPHYKFIRKYLKDW